MSVISAMTWKYYAAMSGAGVLAWLAAAPPSAMPGRVTPAQPSEAVGVTAAASDIEQQASRLQARLRSEALYREPGRNLFRFAGRDRASQQAASAAVETPDVPTVPVAPPPPPLKLSGMAVDGDVRTAILSTPAGIVLARVGDEVVGRYRLSVVEEDAVELITIADGTSFRLTLAR
jgi:hypothetical protein